ncbi:pectinesterase family protein [Paenibacillus sp. RC67]|uniref:pectinesterase family protein n=1 Tax=Paenibacillus sp. RC67 TaxID=3039392 RepID=UPI0024ADB275|nr:pectinesterase family protein [Paenibacillus sp. RC67]
MNLSNKLRTVMLALAVTLCSTALFALAASAEDNHLPQPTYAYDILVDSSLPQDDPANKKFKTLQAAYAAAPAGTAAKQTVIGIKPDVYHITGTETESGLTITKNYITLLGLTEDRSKVVLADNRGNKQGAGTDTTSNNGYVIIVNATGFTAKNLTFLNYCNIDYAYPGDPSKNLYKRSSVETQAVALQSSGDKHTYENVAFLSRLDTFFLQTTRSYCKNCYLEGTADFLGGGTVSVWEDSKIAFPPGNGPVLAASGVVFINTKFISDRGVGFYKGVSNPVAVINSVFPVYTPETPNSWVAKGWGTIVRPNLYSLTYKSKDAKGNPAVISDGVTTVPTFNGSRELSDEEALAFNPWNLLRATPTGAADDWDPAGVKDKYEALGQGSLIYRMAMTGGSPSIRTGGPGATIGATVSPARAPDKTITWSTDSDLITLSATTGPSVVVTGNNKTDKAEYVTVKAKAANGFYITANVFVEPAYIDPPVFIEQPTLKSPTKGTISVNYALDLGNKEDQSVINWYISDDAIGTNSRAVAVSRGNEPLKSYTLTSGDIGKYIRVSVAPKHQISDPGAAVDAVAARPIAASDINSTTVAPNFRNFVTTANNSYVSGLWTVLGTWTSVAGDSFDNGYGVRVGSQGASLLYQQDAKAGDMQINLKMTPEKTGGQGFGSPGSGVDGDTIQKSDIFIKYDPRTKNGYSLRFWRTSQSTEKVMFQIYKHVDGVGSPVSNTQVLSGVFKPNTSMSLKVIGNKFTVSANNDVDDEVLFLEETIAPNDFGGAGAYWSGTVSNGNSNVYSKFEISYPQPSDGVQAVVSGDSQVNAGGAFEMNYGLKGVTKPVYAQQATFGYDPSKVEFVTAESLKYGFYIVDTSIEGKVRFIAASTGQEVDANGDVLKLQWRVKPGVSSSGTSIALTGIVLGLADGKETDVNGITHTVGIPHIDKTALSTLIAEAQSTHDAAKEGAAAGNYPAGSKATLMAAILKASQTADNANVSAAQVEQATSELYAALTQFKASVIAKLPGDLNGDGVIGIGDLAIVAQYYGKTKDDPNWNIYVVADLNGDGIIDILDLAIVASHILDN